MAIVDASYDLEGILYKRLVLGLIKYATIKLRVMNNVDHWHQLVCKTGSGW